MNNFLILSLFPFQGGFFAKDSSVTADSVEGDLTHWKGWMQGPLETFVNKSKFIERINPTKRQKVPRITLVGIIFV